MFEKILVPVDGSALAASALSHVLAVTTPQDASVTVLRVVEPTAAATSMINPIDWQLQCSEASLYLDELVAGYTHAKECQGEATEKPATDDIVVEKVVQGGPVADRILEQAREQGHNLIVISSHGQGGLSGWNVSSVANKVINRSGISILLVRSYKSAENPTAGEIKPAQYRRIMAPLDGSLRSEYVLPVAARLAQQHNAELFLVHGVVMPELFQQAPLGSEHRALIEKVVEYNKRQAESYLQGLSQRISGLPKTYVLTSDDVAESLHRFIDEHNIDLVVLSAHGRSGKHAWPYGSVTSGFITYGTTHLLIVQDLPWQQIEETSAEQATQENKLANIPPVHIQSTTPAKGLSNINAFAFRPNYSRTYSA
ncbi:MAG: universal stress protein [Caldilinea sp.]|uniref:universal stress protein n=1 Tax=Caldilinea sp. TaxID=2293560 RepID=UPI002CCB3384|nr:universal stress protein [Caldilinea sp.]HRA66779.1 universal stress protein [Caldilinea sp.]